MKRVAGWQSFLVSNAGYPSHHFVEVCLLVIPLSHYVTAPPPGELSALAQTEKDYLIK